MVITDDFVMLNSPKTGSTFARTVLREIHRQRLVRRPLWIKAMHRLRPNKRPLCKDLMYPPLQSAGNEQRMDQHGAYSQIPESYRNRPVVSIVRNPYARFISHYEFGWWKNHSSLPDDITYEHFPHFPGLTLDEFATYNDLKITYQVLNGRQAIPNIGMQTISFIRMFFQHPLDVLARLDDDYLDSDAIFEDVADIEFLRQEHLNDDLAEFLARMGYSASEVQYVREHKKENVTKNRSADRDSLWTPTALAYVREKERLLFRLFAAKGIYYEAPALETPEKPVSPDSAQG